MQKEEEFAHLPSPKEKLVRKAPGREEVEQNKASVAQPGRKVSGKLERGLALGCHLGGPGFVCP